MSLRAKIRNMANEKGIDPQVLMQNYMLDHFLERVSKSDYSQNIVLKGGLLITSMVGIDNRNTMDMDASIRGVNFTEDDILKMFKEIANIELGDDITFEVIKVRAIRNEDEYGGLRLTVNAKFFSLTQPLKFDFSTGDKITPREISTNYVTFFDGRSFEVPRQCPR
jgi:predicted nucleotidyltransferase component of viral defense system